MMTPIILNAKNDKNHLHKKKKNPNTLLVLLKTQESNSKSIMKFTLHQL